MLYGEDPIFLNTKIVSSIYEKSFEGQLSKSMAKKIQFDGIEKGLDKISSPNYDALIDLMLEFSDSVILSSDKIEKSTEKIIKNSSKPALSYKDSLDESLLMNFFSKILD